MDMWISFKVSSKSMYSTKDLDELERENPDILATLIPNASIARFAYDNGKWILEELPKWLIACY